MDLSEIEDSQELWNEASRLNDISEEIDSLPDDWAEVLSEEAKQVLHHAAGLIEQIADLYSAAAEAMESNEDEIVLPLRERRQRKQRRRVEMNSNENENDNEDPEYYNNDNEQICREMNEFYNSDK